MNKTELPDRAWVGGCPLSRVSRARLVELAGTWIEDGHEERVITSVNVSKLMMMRRDAGLAECVRESAVTIADGHPVYLAARLLGDPVPGRITGVGLMEDLLSLAGEKGYRVYFLGARPNVLEGAVRVCRERYPGLVVAGSRDGYFGREDEEEIVREVSAAEPDILLVALGMPQKEHFIRKHSGKLKASVILPVGGGLDVLAGEKRRAPALVQKLGVEWLWRSFYDPSRAALIMKNALPFFIMVAQEFLGRRVLGRGRHR